MLQNHCFELLDGKRPGNLDTLDLHNNCVFQLFHHKLCKFLDQAPIFQLLDCHYWKKKCLFKLSYKHTSKWLLLADFICLSGQNSDHNISRILLTFLKNSVFNYLLYQKIKNKQKLLAVFYMTSLTVHTVWFAIFWLIC